MQQQQWQQVSSSLPVRVQTDPVARGGLRLRQPPTHCTRSMAVARTKPHFAHTESARRFGFGVPVRVFEGDFGRPRADRFLGGSSYPESDSLGSLSPSFARRPRDAAALSLRLSLSQFRNGPPFGAGACWWWVVSRLWCTMCVVRVAVPYRSSQAAAHSWQLHPVSELFSVQSIAAMARTPLQALYGCNVCVSVCVRVAASFCVSCLTSLSLSIELLGNRRAAVSFRCVRRTTAREKSAHTSAGLQVVMERTH